MSRVVGEYKILCTLGQGIQGKVKKAQKKDGSVVALKLVKKSTLTASSVLKLRREVEAMYTCKHPAVTRLNNVDWNFMYPKKDGSKLSCVLMELEFAEGGELFNFLMYTGCFPENIARTYFQQIIQGLHHCHSKGISHRDLKAENLLLDKNFKLKIADFGLSAIHDAPAWLETQCGTKGYMAPEILSKSQYKGPLVDIWSLGVVLFIMLTGFPPFQIAQKGDWWFDRVSKSQYRHFWKAHLRNARVSEAAQDLMNKIFVVDPTKRASLKAISEHPWVRDKTLSPDAIKADLSRRKAKVEQARRAEKRQKQLEKRRAMGATFDPDAAVYRGVKREATVDAKALPKALPVPAEGVSHFTSFHVKEEAPEILSRLEQSLSKLSAKKQILPGYKVKASVNTPIGDISIAIQIYADGDNHVVELRRRRGGTLKFQQLYNSICDDLADIIEIV
jgi:serine/threonine protein kinase